MSRHRQVARMCRISLLVSRLLARLQLADALPRRLLQTALPRGHRRKLLSCAVVPQPMYMSEGQDALPLCTTQYINTGGSEKWVPVTADVRNPTFRATAADLALAWHLDAGNPKTDSTMECSGVQDMVKKLCWAGKSMATDTTFRSLSCCTMQLVCYIKTGGCVMQHLNT